MMFCLKSKELLMDIRYGINIEVAIPEDFLDPKLKLLFVQDYTTNLKGEQTAHSPFPFG